MKERTGMRIDRALLDVVVRERAAEEHRSEEELIEDAVRRYLMAAGSGGLPEEEAEELALALVRRARAEAPERGEELPAPSPEEVKARRDELRLARAEVYSAARSREGGQDPGSS